MNVPPWVTELTCPDCGYVFKNFVAEYPRDVVAWLCPKCLCKFERFPDDSEAFGLQRIAMRR